VVVVLACGLAIGYLEVELEVRWVTGGRCALYELVLLEVRAVRLEEVLLPPPAPPATLANCSGVSCFFGSFMVIGSFCSVGGCCFGLWTGC
jgi:hypothetical protein